MKDKTEFKISKRTVAYICIVCALVLIISVIMAETVSLKYENTYSIETSKLHPY